MRDIRDLPMLTEAMLKRGWSEQRIRKFLGEPPAGGSSGYRKATKNTDK
jgi:hypothetical protein